MKSTLLLLGVLLSSPSFAAQTTTVKVADGTSAYCRSDKDLNSRGNAIGLYKVKASKAQIVEDFVEVEVDIQFLKCTKSSRGFSFQEVAPFAGTNIFQNFYGKDVEVKTEAIELKAYKDGVYKVLFNQDVVLNEAQQKITMTLPIEEVLNNGTQNRTIYEASFDIFMIKDLSYNRLDGKASVKNKARYGSYRIHMDLNLDKGTVKLK